MPRLVRKTSFDHKVRERSMSRGPRRDQLAAEAANNRKRPFRDDLSPARPPMQIPITMDQRIAAGLSRNIASLGSRGAPTSSLSLSSVPSGSFDFAVPQPGSLPHQQLPLGANPALGHPTNRSHETATDFDSLLETLASQAGTPTTNLMTGASASPQTALGSGSGASPITLPNGAAAAGQQNPADLEAIMNMFYNSDAGLGGPQPSFTHINPNQVFGGPSTTWQARSATSQLRETKRRRIGRIARRVAHRQTQPRRPAYSTTLSIIARRCRAAPNESWRLLPSQVLQLRRGPTRRQACRRSRRRLR